MKTKLLIAVLVLIVCTMCLCACGDSVTVNANTITSFEGATIDGTDILLVVDNDVEYVSLSDIVRVSKKSIWKLYVDILGQNELAIKIATVQEGDNTFYIFVTDGKDSTVYTLTIHRKYSINVNYYDKDGELYTTRTTYTYEPVARPVDYSINGYTLNAWHVDSVDGAVWDQASAYSTNGDVNLYAQVTPNTYHLTFHYGYGTPVELDVTYGETYKFDVPSKLYYTFNYWYFTEYNEYYEDVYWYVNVCDEEGNCTWIWHSNESYDLYPRFDQNLYRVNVVMTQEGCHCYYGEPTDDYPYNTKVSVTADHSDDYDWVGWGTTSDYIVCEDTTYTFNMPANYLTLYAIWIEHPTLEKSIEEAGDVSSSSVGNQVTIQATTNSGYFWGGWYEGDTKVSDAMSYTYKATLTDRTFTAKWIAISVENDIGGDISPLPANLNIGQTVSLTATCYLGYVWDGWYDGNTKICDDMTFTFEVQGANKTYSTKRHVAPEMAPFTFESTDTTATITGVYDHSKTIYNIPSYVTSIGESAFDGCTIMSKITIPSSITSIGSGAFDNCNSLANVCISSVEAWCDITFGNAHANPLWHGHNLYLDGKLVTELVIPDGVTNIGNYAFYYCTSATSISISNSVTNIGASAFSYCSGLTSITIPNSVTSIGADAFNNSRNLTEVHVSDIGAWCEISFGSSTANPNYYAKNLYLNGELVSNLVIPDGTTHIGDYAFYVYDSLTSISIPSSVTSIGNYACYKCSGLTTVTFEENSQLTGIGEYAFAYCDSLTGISLPNSVENIGIAAFRNCSSLTSISIPDSLTAISAYAFWNCSSLSSVDIGENSQLTEIAGTSFRECTSLTSINIPNSVTRIGHSAFRGCSSLININIDKNSQLSEIGEDAFYGCSSLTSIFIPNGVTSLSYGVFYGCGSLVEITIPFVGATADPSSSGTYQYPFGYIFGSTSYAGSVSVSQEYCGSNANDYRTAYYRIPSTLRKVTVTGGNLVWGSFENCSMLTDVIIDEGVADIGVNSFKNCSNLKFISIPSSVTRIGGSAFQGCNKLTIVNISDIGAWCGIQVDTDILSNRYLYINGELATDIIIPSYVTLISAHAFYGCISLTSVTFEKDSQLNEIGAGAFAYCINLTSLMIPKSIQKVGYDPFEECTKLTLYLETGVDVTSSWNPYWNKANRPIVWGYVRPED